MSSVDSISEESNKPPLKTDTQMLLPTFIDGSDYSSIMEVLLSLAQTCPKCLGKKVHFCMQQLCQEQTIFCLKCQKQKHTLHRINELYLAFVDRNTVPTRSGQAISFLTKLIEQLSEKKQSAERLMLELVITQQKLTETIEKYQQIRRNIIEQTQLDELYAHMSEGLRMYRKQVSEENEEPPKWKQLSQKFIKTSKSAKFYNNQKLQNCLNLFEVGFYIEQFQKSMEAAKSKNQGKSKKPTKDDLSFGKCERGYWARHTQNRRRKLFNRDLISLFQQTHLSQYVSSKWNFIPIQLGLTRAAVLPDHEIITHRPHRLIINNSSYQNKFVEKFISGSNTTKQFKWCGQWSETKMPANATFLSLSINNKLRPHFPSNLKKLHLRLKANRRPYAHYLRNQSFDSQPEEDAVSLYDLIFSLEKLRQLVLCKEHWQQDEIDLITQKARSSELCTMALYNSDSSHQVIVQNMISPVQSLGIVRKQWRRAMLQGLLMLRNRTLNNLHCRQRLIQAAMCDTHDKNHSIMLSEMDSSVHIRLKRDRRQAQQEHSGLRWLIDLQEQ